MDAMQALAEVLLAVTRTSQFPHAAVTDKMAENLYEALCLAVLPRLQLSPEEKTALLVRGRTEVLSQFVQTVPDFWSIAAETLGPWAHDTLPYHGFVADPAETESPAPATQSDSAGASAAGNLDDLRQFVEDMIHQAGMTNLPDDYREKYVAQLTAQLQERLGLRAMQELDEKQLDEFEHVAQSDNSAAAVFTFFNTHVTDFPTKMAAVMHEFRTDFVEHAQRSRKELSS